MSDEKPPEEKTLFEIAQYFAKRSHEVRDKKSQEFLWGMALIAAALAESNIDAIFETELGNLEDLNLEGPKPEG